MRRPLLIAALSIGLGAAAWFGWADVCVQLGTPPAYRGESAGDGPILVVGDIQPTSLAERLFLGREENGSASEKLLRAMADEEPRFVALLGDLVFDGDRCGDWERADALLRPLRDTGAGFVVAPGNHDWRGRDSLCRAHLHARFSHLREAPFSETHLDGIVLLQLDSNEDALGAQWQTQAATFAARLEALETDDAVRAVLVLTHHPPMTNSVVTTDEAHVEDAFVGPFLDATKTVAFLSGHAHAYERFERDGKSFIVSGGGGGPRVSLLDGAGARHSDLFEAPSPRPFHYLRIDPVAEGIEVRVIGFATGELGTHELERFVLAYP